MWFVPKYCAAVNKQVWWFSSQQGRSHISCMPGTVRRWNYPSPLCIGKYILHSLAEWPLFSQLASTYALPCPSQSTERAVT